MAECPETQPDKEESVDKEKEEMEELGLHEALSQQEQDEDVKPPAAKKTWGRGSRGRGKDRKR